MEVQIESILQNGSFKKYREEQIVELRKKYDLKKVELEILYFLSHCGDHNTSTDIHYQLMMNRGHISQAVDSLCRRKYLRAIPDQNDRRYVHYEVQDSARDIIFDMGKMEEEMNRQILKGISEEELQIFRNVALKMKQNIENLTKKTPHRLS